MGGIKWVSISTTAALSLVFLGTGLAPDLWTKAWWFYLVGIVALGVIAQVIYDRRGAEAVR